MKTLSFLVFTMLLVSCGLTPARFDSVEYQHLVYLNITADNDQGCNALENHMMNFYARVLVRYSANTTNKNIANIYTQIQALTQELVDHKEPTDTYCNLKKQNIRAATEQALAVYGARSHE